MLRQAVGLLCIQQWQRLAAPSLALSSFQEAFNLPVNQFNQTRAASTYDGNGLYPRPDAYLLASSSRAGTLCCNAESGGLQLQQVRTFFGAGDTKKHDERKLIGYSPEQLYSIVSQVENYAHFVPWCQRSTVLQRVQDQYIEAELEVGFQIFVERYISKVTLKRPTEVRSTVTDSTLFHHLNCAWVMQPGPNSSTCWLSFRVEFAFKSALYRNLADLFFKEVVQQMMQAFENRCESVYGRPSLYKPKLTQ